jgi:hypothetical protein
LLANCPAGCNNRIEPKKFDVHKTEEPHGSECFDVASFLDLFVSLGLKGDVLAASGYHFINSVVSLAL